MTEAAAALLRLRDLLGEAILWAEVNDDTLMAIRHEEARTCVQQRIDEKADPLR